MSMYNNVICNVCYEKTEHYCKGMHIFLLTRMALHKHKRWQIVPIVRQLMLFIPARFLVHVIQLKQLQMSIKSTMVG